MKAIKVTKKLKEDNPNHLKNYKVGDWFFLNNSINYWNNKMPFNPEEEGFKDLVSPKLSENQKYEGIYENSDGNPEYKVVNKSMDDSFNEETRKYIKRQRDGLEFYLKIIAKLRVAKLEHSLTQHDFRVIESLLKPFRTEISAGQWISAREILKELDPNIIGKDRYEEILESVTNYIDFNYK